MKYKNKILHFGSVFKAVEEDENKELIILGMASTDDKDRMGDIISPDAWAKGLKNFKKNPIILFNHNYNRPIGKAIDVKSANGGLELTAKISKAAGEIVGLIKDGVLGAFSVGFMIKDADYDSDTDTFVIKEAELLEVSVVSVPANQAATFSVQKSFDTEDDYKDFLNTYKSVTQASGQDLADKSNDALASETPEGPTAAEIREKKMDELEIQEIMKQAAKVFASTMAMSKAEEKAADEAKARVAAEAEAKEKATSERISVAVRSGAEDLIKDLTARFAEKEADFGKIIEEMRGDLTEKAEDIRKMRDSRAIFSERTTGKRFSETNAQDFVDAHILGAITQKGWKTKMGAALMEKATNDDGGVRAPAAAEDNFETIVSTTIERDIELELVLAPLFRTIQMNAASMVIPTMPDAGYAQFLSGAGTGAQNLYKGNLEDRDAASPGANTGITMGAKVLTTAKLVSKSYIANETEEDAIIPILPLIREALVRAHARAVEHSILLGGSTADLITSGYLGLYKLAVDDSKVLGVGSPIGTATAASLLNLRQTMGKYGRRPGDVVYIVSLDAYYDLLDDPEFQNINEVGALATKVRGEIGQVYGSAVIVCDEFPAKVNDNVYAVAVNTRNFLVPILRGVTAESDYDVENQHRVLVVTQRRSFDRLFADAGQVTAHTW